jgi:hypothetical protein
MSLSVAQAPPQVSILLIECASKASKVRTYCLGHAAYSDGQPSPHKLLASASAAEFCAFARVKQVK